MNESRDEILSFFAKFIHATLGIVYSSSNYFQLENRLNEIAKLIGVQSLEQLYATAVQGIAGSFYDLLLDIATNNETSFFRDSKVFEAIEKEILPQFSSGRTLNIWSAASSTGQESLSVSIVVLEYCKKYGLEIPFSVLASDICQRVLDRAISGEYTQLEVQRGLPAQFLVKYFENKAERHWKVVSLLQKHIQYKKVNLTQPFGFLPKFDLILCRNVLIYQTVESKLDIIARMSKHLHDGGHLIVGAGESLLGLSSDFELKNVSGAILYQKKNRIQNAA